MLRKYQASQMPSSKEPHLARKPYVPDPSLKNAGKYIFCFWKQYIISVYSNLQKSLFWKLKLPPNLVNHKIVRVTLRITPGADFTHAEDHWFELNEGLNHKCCICRQFFEEPKNKNIAENGTRVFLLPCQRRCLPSV